MCGMVEWVTDLIQQSGHFGVFMLMFLENVFPPIPSEIILPLAGFMVSSGEFNFLALLASSTAGAVAGAVFWYYIGLKLGQKRVEKWVNRHSRLLAMTPKDYRKTEAFFIRHSGKSVFFGRMIPTFRSLISIPAGIFAMNLKRFLIFTTAGTLIWNGLLISAGYALQDEYTRISEPVNSFATIIIFSIFALYVIRLVQTYLIRK